MSPRFAAACIGFIALAAVGCDSNGGEELPDVERGSEFAVSGPFDDGGAIPEKYTCDGDDVSPALEWELVPEVREYALVMTDPDAPGGTFVHWVVWGLRGGGLPEGELPADAEQGTNSFGNGGYGGPCPPEGDDAHRYEFTVYALRGNPTTDLSSESEAADLLDAINCCIEASGTLTGTYAR
jgi:Raf kinase inhibitor-like YbhB/YbcL family protein